MTIEDSAPAGQGGFLDIMNWTAIPEIPPTGGLPALQRVRGSAGGDVPVFREQLVELRNVLSLLTYVDLPTGHSMPSLFMPALPPAGQPAFTTLMDLFNQVPDTERDGVVDVGEDLSSFGVDTGVIGLLPDHDMPQVYLPHPTSGGGSSLLLHDYIVQGGFGSSRTSVGSLVATASFNDTDAGESGQPFAWSRDTRVRNNMVIHGGMETGNKKGNHIKRVEVVRPRGNAVVFEFEWNLSAKRFSPWGTPAGNGGRDAKRLYVLRDLTPEDNEDVKYELQFTSGITHVFDGGFGSGLSRVRDVYGNEHSFVGAGSRYAVLRNWAGGRLSGVDYATQFTEPVETIRTTVGYGAGNAIESLQKAWRKPTGDVAIPEFSYALTGASQVDHNGVVLRRSGSWPGASVELELTVPQTPGSLRRTFQYNGDGLVTGDTISLTNGLSTSSATTSYTYSTGGGQRYGNGAPLHGKVTSVTYPEGSWAKFSYDAATGWVTKTVTPFKSSAATDDEALSVVREMSYGTAGVGGVVANTRRFVEFPRAVSTKVQGILTGTSYRRFEPDGEIISRVAISNSSPTWAQATLETVVAPSSSGFTFQGPAGLVHYTSVGGVLTNVWRDWLGEDHPEGSSPLSHSGRRNYEQQWNPNKLGIPEYSFMRGRGVTQIAVASNGVGETDAFGRILRSTASGNVRTEFRDYGWHGPAQVLAPDKSLIDYTYAPSGLVETAKKLGVTATYGYDAAGNSIATTLSAQEGEQTRMIGTTAAYDALGRMTSFVDEVSRETTFSYATDASGIISETTTYADLTTSVEKYHLDGSPHSVDGSATHRVEYDHGIVAEGGGGLSAGDTWTKASFNLGQNWTKQYFNSLGQNYRTERSGPGGAVVVAATEFDGNGRPVKYTDFDGTVTLTQYDPLSGEVGAVVLDVDRSGAYRPGDRKTLFRSDPLNYLETNSYSGTEVEIVGNGGSTIFSEESTALSTGGVSSRRWVNGSEMTQVDVTYPAAGGEVVTTTLPDSTLHVLESSGGLPVSERKLGWNGTEVWSKTFGHDVLRRIDSVTDWIGTTRFGLRDDGSVQSALLSDEERTISSTVFDQKTGMPERVVRQNGTEFNRTINDRALQANQSGAGVLPASFSYHDRTGQLTSLTTYQSGSLTGTGASTTWLHDDATGLLKSKSYADNTKDEYSWNSALQLQGITRPGVTAALAYNNAGEVERVTYTPVVGPPTVSAVEARDDKGQPLITTQTTDGRTTTEVVTYTPEGRVDSETFGHLGTVQVAYTYAPDDRSVVELMTLRHNGEVLASYTFDYDDVARRLEFVTTGDGKSFTYSYLADSDRVESLDAVGEAKTTWTYEPGTGRLQSLATWDVAGTPDPGDDTLLSERQYAYNAIDQRLSELVTTRDHTGVEEAHAVEYGYNAGDELISVNYSSAGLQDLTYGYDGVGNRTTPSTFGTVNALNQYSNFTYDGRGQPPQRRHVRLLVRWTGPADLGRAIRVRARGVRLRQSGPATLEEDVQVERGLERRGGRRLGA
jgi:hypothetical protein